MMVSESISKDLQFLDSNVAFVSNKAESWTSLWLKLNYCHNSLVEIGISILK